MLGYRQQAGFGIRAIQIKEMFVCREVNSSNKSYTMPFNMSKNVNEAFFHNILIVA